MFTDIVFQFHDSIPPVFFVQIMLLPYVIFCLNADYSVCNCSIIMHPGRSIISYCHQNFHLFPYFIKIFMKSSVSAKNLSQTSLPRCDYKKINQINHKNGGSVNPPDSPPHHHRRQRNDRQQDAHRHINLRHLRRYRKRLSGDQRAYRENKGRINNIGSHNISH